MEALIVDRELQTQGVEKEGEFSISLDDQSHILSILRDQIYTDKVLAVLREYSSNAWDAHREVDKGDLPIEVHLPEPIDPTLTIRDFGPGISDEGIFSVYTKYGKSTRRGTNNAVGMLGIGSKSGFAYSDTFTVTSWHGGFKRVYVAALDESEKGVMQRLDEEPCKPSETGIEIKIPVDPTDCYEFQRKARDLFKHFIPQPKINMDLPEFNPHVRKHGWFEEEKEGVYSNKEWVAVMGCVPYRVDMSQVHSELEEQWQIIDRLRGGIFFNIGEVHIAANREELKYSEYTKEAIITKLQLLVEEYIDEVIAALKDDSPLTDWEKRIRARFMSGSMGIPLPVDFKDWGKEQVRLWAVEDKDGKPIEATTFTWKEQRNRLFVRDGAQIIIRDGDKDIRGYDLSSNFRIAMPKIKPPPAGPAVPVAKKAAKTKTPAALPSYYSAAEVRVEIDALLEAVKLKGLPVNLISSRDWNAWRLPGRLNRRSRSGPSNPKHKVRSFQLDPKSLFKATRSARWAITERTPGDDDVFVLLESFHVVNHKTFYRTYGTDAGLARLFKIGMPTVFGYKSTEKKPVRIEDCKGVEYHVWRKVFFKEVLTSEENLLLDAYRLKMAFDDDPDTNPYQVKARLETYTALVKGLPGHPLTKLFQRVLRGSDRLKAGQKPLVRELGRIDALVRNGSVSEEEKEIKRVVAKYPLLQVSGGILTLQREHLSEWMEYIQMVDKQETP